MKTQKTVKPILNALLNASESFADDKPEQPETGTHKPKPTVHVSDLPWEVCDHQVLTKELNDYGNFNVCSVKRLPELTYQDKMNLAFIVRACNNAERLAEALKECLVAHSRDNYYNSLRRVASAEAAREALAQWEQQQ